MKAVKQKEEGDRRHSSRDEEKNRVLRQGGWKEWRVRKSPTLGSFECSGHRTWSRLQYLLLFGS